jgi:hypothetical protein
MPPPVVVIMQCRPQFVVASLKEASLLFHSWVRQVTEGYAWHPGREPARRCHAAPARPPVRYWQRTVTAKRLHIAKRQPSPTRPNAPRPYRTVVRAVRRLRIRAAAVFITAHDHAARSSPPDSRHRP